MASIYLAKYEPELGHRAFHLGELPLSEIVGQFELKPQHRESEVPRLFRSEERLLVVISVKTEESKRTDFEAGYYRATIPPYRALRYCGVGLSHILGTARSELEN